MKRTALFLAALLACGTAAGQETKRVNVETRRVDGSSAISGYGDLAAPSGCASGYVPYFNASLELVCSPTVWNPTTKSLDVTDGRVQAANLKAIGLATPGGITVVPTLTQVGSITVLGGSDIVDGDYFTIDYGPGVVPIEFDELPGDGTTGGRIAYVFDPLLDADAIRDGLITLINASAPTYLTASIGGAGVISLVLDTPGAVGDPITENVTNAGFLVSGFADPTAATTVTYQLVACLADGSCTQAGADSTTGTSTATLSVSNFNRLSWSAVTGAASYKVYRKVAPTSPATVGVIYSGTALTVDDTGLVGDTTTASTVDTTGLISADGLRIGTSAVAGHVLTMDANGYATPQAGGGGITNSAGANVIPKSDGTNLVASSVTDDGTTLTLGNAGVTVTEATGAVELAAQATGTTPLTLRAASGQTADLYKVISNGGTVTMFAFGPDGNWTTRKNNIDKTLYWALADTNGAISIQRGSAGTARYLNVFRLSNLLSLSYGDGSALSVSTTGHIIPKADNTTGKAAWGDDAASPQAITHVMSAGGSGTNVAGARANVYAGLGSGSAVPGPFAIQSGFPGSSGSTANTPADRDYVGFPKTLTESTETGVLSIAVASGTVTGGTFYYTIEANDATDYQSLRGRVDFVVANKAGTLTRTLGTPVEVTALSSGTLTNTVTLTAGTNAVVLNLNAVSSLTQTTLRATPRLTLDGGTGLVSPL